MPSKASDLTDDEKDFQEAKKFCARVMDWEGECRKKFLDDVKFGNGDDTNGYQWPQDLMSDRNIAKKPTLTYNKTRQHCLQIINDARQNKPGIAIHAVGNGASVYSAEIIEGIARHIENNSNAQLAYDAATWNQVFGGYGYIRLTTDFANDRSVTEQEIFIRRVANPRNVLLDPDIQEFDGSDARAAVYFEDLPRAEAEAKYPEIKDDFSSGSISEDNWNTKDVVRVAEYFRKNDVPDTLVMMPSGMTALMSEIPQELRGMIPKDAPRRPIMGSKIEWLHIVGNKVVDRKEWPGKYIPFVRVIGEETVIDGVLDRKGHVRFLRNAQQSYNYWASAAVEHVALQTKTPWVTPAAAVEGNETYWDTANTVNHAYLPYKHTDDAGNPIPKPERSEPPVMAQAFIEGMKLAQEQMMLVSGQYQAVMGEPSNETSGKAINARQRQGENSTYHYIDHQASAIRLIGRMLIDLIPKIYDTARVMMIMGKDGQRKPVKLVPDHPKAASIVGPNNQPVDPDDDRLADDGFAAKVQTIFNPNIGDYDVIADVGPNYATARQEAFNAFSQIMQQNPAAFNLVGDLWAENADFPQADVFADRMRKLLPAPLQGGPSPQMAQLHQQMEQGAQQALAHIDGLQKQIAELTKKLGDQTEDLSREKYEAETKRLSVIKDIDPDLLKPFLRAEATAIIGHPIMDIIQAHNLAEQMAQPPQPVQPPQPQQGGALNG